MVDQTKRRTIPSKDSVETILRSGKPKKGDTPIAKLNPTVKESSSMNSHIMAGIGGAIVGGIIIRTGGLMRL